MAEKFSAAKTVRIVQATPTIGTSAYASGDLIGSAAISFKLPLGSEHKERAGLIQSVLIIDLAKQSANLDLVFFDTVFAGTTFTDNAAFDPSDTDILNYVGTASVTDWKAFNDSSVGQALNLSLPFVISGWEAPLYAVLVSRGTPTYAATDLTIKVGIVPLI